MVRLFAVACTLCAVLLVAGHSTVDAQVKKMNQMVKGTIKSVDSDTKVLIVSQKVKNEAVDRQLSIDESVEFMITMKNGEKKTANGRSGLLILEREKATGSMVQVKCDKDVNVLSVKVSIK